MDLDQIVVELSPVHVPKHDELFGKGRGRLGYLIYRRLTGNPEVDKLDIYVSRINRYLEKSKDYLKRGFFRNIIDTLFDKKETPKRYLNRAVIGFLVTEQLTLASDGEVTPETSMKKLNMNVLEIGNLRTLVERNDFAGMMQNQASVYKKAVKKRVSYIIDKFSQVN